MARKKEPEEFDFSIYAFIDLNRSQKLAIINFLSVIASSDANKKINKNELAYISEYYKEFGVTGDQYIAYISIGGRKQTAADIKTLSKSNMQDLVYATTELCNCGGCVDDEELIALFNWLDLIGMSIEEWNDYLEHPGNY